jgi:hypothetical protein
MNHIMIRRLANSAAAAALAVLTLSAPAAATPEPVYPPDGSWLAIATMSTPAGELSVPFMDTYTSLPTRHGRRGTVLCTLALPLPPLPLGPNGAPVSVAGTQTAHGGWTRVRKNEYAFTAWRLLVGPDGYAVGWAKFWGFIKPDAPNHFTGEINAAYYTLAYAELPIPPASLSTEGWKVAADPR